MISFESGEYNLPGSELQAIRASICWIGKNPNSTPCPNSASACKFSDVDDLAFVVDTTSFGGTLNVVLSQPGPAVLHQLPEEELHCKEVLKSDWCEAAIGCEWTSASLGRAATPYSKFKRLQ